MSLNKLGQVEVSKFAYGQQQGSVNVGFVWDSEKSDKIFKALFGAPSSKWWMQIFIQQHQQNHSVHLVEE